MKAHYFQHVPFEGLGSIESWLEKNNFTITSTKFFAEPTLPDPEQVDFLIIMGGPMSVNDQEEYPWLHDELNFIREFIQRDKPVLGVCLGAQLIASAMGSKIYPNKEKEIGWFPIQGSQQQTEGTFSFPASATVFHWHGETFDLPEGATHLAQSEACKNQAFQKGNAIGLQCHLETTPESARNIISHCRNELVPAQYIQDEQTILSADAEVYASLNQLMAKVLDFLSKQINS
ncbi:MAG: gamma-glutamyl-gamma-aminobutyrate hydrolase family protein [Candidatus Electrothrix aestuarii]|uniref:Gamma-glutamyl-gamma-aminobutyrate hydrolase family protein n=1 Tax=Candidatus Electrothrix aestuarii TaxID=3062594 RepID=A0AAU8LW72_9BACT|nr:gamma-glutamyl-gamma-aminobutyrate hydrolase family protein [Candidatus Electrothrix aestuarii]